MSNIDENGNKFLSNDIRHYLWQNSNYVPVTTTLAPVLFSCYDDYYCNSDNLAIIGHIFLGVLALISTILSLALNVLLIPILGLVGIRSSATYYMIGMAISDCCIIIINVLLVVIRYFPSNSQMDQLHVYQSFVAYLVPFGFPLKTLCQTLSISFCACLMIDRFVYYQTERKSNTAKRAVAVKVMVSVIVWTIVLKLPNFLVYKIVENTESSINVQWTLMAKSWIFIVDLLIFLIIYGILLLFTFILWYVVMMHGRRVKRISDEVSHTKLFQRRERLYIKIGLIVGACSVCLKFPQLLHNIFFGFSTNRDRKQMEKLAVADIWMEASDYLLIVSRPCIYVLLMPHCRRALIDMIGLWVSPSRYTVLKASGGLGKLVDLSKCDNDFSTTNSLLRVSNSQKSMSKGDIDTLAAQCVMETGKNGSNSATGSYDSVVQENNNDRLRF